MSEIDDTREPDRTDNTGELEPVEPSESFDGPFQTEPERRITGLPWVVVQALIALLVLFLLAFDPYAFTAVEEIIGFGLIAFGLFELVHVVRKRHGAGAFVQPLAAIVGGIVLWVWPGQTLIVAGYFLAGVIAIRGVLDVWAGIRKWHEPGANTWVFVRGLIALSLSVLMFLFPAQSVAFIVVGGAALVLLRGIVAVWFAVTNHQAMSTIDPANTYAVVTYWLSRREMDAVAADEVENRVFLTHGNTRERLWRFAILMVLATAIATFGIATDSTAVVIGAMLVAPLMTPILGTSAGLINGKTRSTLWSATITMLGALGAIVVAWALSALIPDIEAVVQNGQVTSRTAPSLLDLAIALAAGAAGAYGVSRAESTDALPGVAVAIALVPPLAVVGLTLHAEDFGQAGGALLLFLTNLFSIVLMAGLVFVLVGYGSWSRLYNRRNRIRVSFALVMFAVILITIPLALTARDVLFQEAFLRDASGAVSDWLGEESETRISSIDVDGDRVYVNLIGPDEPPPASKLSDELSSETGRTVIAVVRWVEEQEDIGLTGSPTPP
ncbi:MAG: TIGR00341 family protein [Acidimicrobiia bacterium]